MQERLQKILSRCGVASRRKAEELIIQERVFVNGVPVNKLGSKADPATDSITVDGRSITPEAKKVYILLHKPAGYICSLSDPQGRPTVGELVSGISERVFPVGRLDYDTEGLLLLTNDGEFSYAMQHPRFNIKRTYRVKVRGVPESDRLDMLAAGVVLDGVKTHKSAIRFIGKARKNTWLEVVLKEGRNRQLKKMFSLIGHPAMRIIRIKFGPFALGRLPSGSFRTISPDEVKRITASI